MKIFLFIVLAAVLGIIAYQRHLMMWIDSMNVYRLRLGGSKVFGRLNRFISKQGLPREVKIYNEITPIESIDDLNNAIMQATESRYELFLLYEGYTMNYFNDGRLVIWNHCCPIKN